MYQIQSTPKSFTVRAFAALLAASVLLTPLAMAAEGSVTVNSTASVATLNTLSIDAGGTVALAPTVAAAVTDSSTVLSFGTNDGVTYRITVVATAWGFVPNASGSVEGAYPVLRFVSASSTAGTQSETVGVLIDAANAVQLAVPVVTAIKNASGTATVTLDASITQAVVAGTYTTTLTYELVLP